MAQTVSIKATSSPRRVDINITSDGVYTFAYVGSGIVTARPSATSTDLAASTASISLVSPNGESAQFDYGDITTFTIDAADQLPTATNLDLVLTALAPFFFNVAQLSPVGFSYVQEWGDLANDSSTQDYRIFYNSGSSLVSSGTSSAAFQHSGRSVDTVTGPFTIVLEGTLAESAAFGLNNQTTATYPASRYSRSIHAWVTTPATISGAIFSRVYESGVNIGINKQWLASQAAVMLGIADTGSAIKYAYSLDEGATWIVSHTSAVAYVPGQVWKIDGVLNFGRQYMRVRKYNTALF